VGVLTKVAAERAVGEMAGLPVVTDANIPITINPGVDLTSGTQDAIFVGRWSDVFLYEGRTQYRAYPGALCGTLTTRLQAYRYAAFAPGRYPGAISVITGTGLTTPTF
jgi:hypothetical protein